MSETESAAGSWARARLAALYQHSRALGGFLVLVGLAGAYVAQRSLVANVHSARALTGIPGAFAFCVTLGVLGVICLIGGQRALDTLCRKGMGWVRYAAFLTVCVALPCFLAFLWMLHQINEAAN